MELKSKYSNLLHRYEKAKDFMDCYILNGKALNDAIAEREKYLPQFLNLIKDMDKILEELASKGISVSSAEILNGFSIKNVGE